MDLIANNDPNNEWGKHVVEIVVKCWSYEKCFTQRVGGNCHGLTVMEVAILNLHEDLMDEDGNQAKVVLTDPVSGDTLLCEDEEQDDDWLKKMVVSCRIVGFEPKASASVGKV